MQEFYSLTYMQMRGKVQLYISDALGQVNSHFIHIREVDMEKLFSLIRLIQSKQNENY
jgi:hypothetical protein